MIRILSKRTRIVCFQFLIFSCPWIIYFHLNFDQSYWYGVMSLFPFSFPLFFTSRLDDMPFPIFPFAIGSEFGIIQSSAYFQLKWCSSVVDDCNMKKTVQTRKFAICVGMSCACTAKWQRDPKFIYIENVEKNFDYKTMNEKMFNVYRISSKCN